MLCIYYCTTDYRLLTKANQIQWERDHQKTSLHALQPFCRSLATFFLSIFQAEKGYWLLYLGKWYPIHSQPSQHCSASKKDNR